MFQMKNCRSLLKQLSGGEGDNLHHELIAKIENAVNEQSNAAFDLCYSLIDTTCKTIHHARGEDDYSSTDLPKRFKNTLKLLNLVPASNGKSEPQGIDRTLRGLESAVRGLCELRNDEGIISHGKPANFQPMDLLQLQFAAQTTDLVVHYLYQAHFDYPMPPPEIAYADNPKFNDYVDDLYEPLEVFGQIIKVSEVLFDADESHAAYKEQLRQYALELEEVME